MLKIVDIVYASKQWEKERGLYWKEVLMRIIYIPVWLSQSIFEWKNFPQDGNEYFPVNKKINTKLQKFA